MFCLESLLVINTKEHQAGAVNVRIAYTNSKSMSLGQGAVPRAWGETWLVREPSEGCQSCGPTAGLARHLGN